MIGSISLYRSSTHPQVEIIPEIGMALDLSSPTKGPKDQLTSGIGDFKEREKLVAEEAEKLAGGSGSAASSSSAAKASKKKKKKKPEPATVARKLRVNPSPSGEQKTAAVCWEVIPEDRPRKAAPAKAELHRPELRDWIKKQDPRIRIQGCF